MQIKVKQIEAAMTTFNDIIEGELFASSTGRGLFLKYFKRGKSDSNAVVLVPLGSDPLIYDQKGEHMCWATDERVRRVASIDVTLEV